ncbi:MAG: ankyrin repeat domain-containing protein, partial [Chloroflexi bacterium]|nr:ankyrin repeat domain-containing protein [Chloroflexota bacterium]
MLYRSHLFVPGGRQELLDKAGGLSADVLCLDLEESVLPEEKERARGLVGAAVPKLAEAGKTVHVRVNSIQSGETRDDLAAAVQKGLSGAVLAKGAQVDLQTKGGAAPLFISSQTGQAGVVHTLLAEGARVDLQDRNGWTALMIASQNGREKILQALLAQGARVDLQNKDGETAIRVAQTRRIKELLEAA